ncbi:MAG: type 4a pilus biogenesis protein PilO, partial [Patescibacteria group bacterium]|nr:type 4a pilus biogenesis protein PilO [Patescibacteria group bacterium]
MELDKEVSLDNIKELLGSLGDVLGELVVPIVSVGVSVLLVLLVVVPGIRDIQEAREEKLEKEETLRALEEKSALLSRYAAQSQRLDSALGVVRHAIPLEDEVPEVMTQLQDMADISGVTVSNLTYRSGSGEEAEVETVGMNFGFDGSFSNIKGLFELMENASRIVVADQFNLRVQEEASMSAS